MTPNRIRATIRSWIVGAAIAAATGLAFVPATQAVDLTAGLLNVAPAVVSVTLPTVTPTAGTTTDVATTIVVSDANGYNDVSSVEVTVLKPDGSTVHVAAASATFSSGLALEATYTYTFQMNFHDPAATGTTTYMIRIVATDAAGATGDNTLSLATFNYAQLAALNVGSSAISLGTTLQPGDTTSIVGESIQNYGNVQIDVQMSGTALSHATEAASIPVGAVTYSLAGDMTGAAALSGTPATLASFDLAAGASSARSIYVRADIPSGSSTWLPSGTYTGTLTVTAVQG